MAASLSSSPSSTTHVLPQSSAAVHPTPPSVPAVIPTPPMTTKRGFLFRNSDWGPTYWRFMHAVTFLYPDTPTAEDRQRILDIFSNMPFVLPCSLCGLHLVQNMKTLPLSDAVLTSKTTLSMWLVELHNMVNRQLRKPEVAYEDVRYFHAVDSTHPLRPVPDAPTNGWKVSTVVLGLLLLLLVLGVLAFYAHKQYSPKTRNTWLK